MSDIEDRIRAEMRIDPTAPDEAFVAHVALRVEAGATRRAVGLTLASLLAAGLVGAMIATLAGLWPLLSAQLPQNVQLVPAQALSMLSSAGAAIGVLVVTALLAPLAQLRR